MSRQSSGDKRDVKGRRTIMREVEEVDVQTSLQRKRSERQASQGVKLLVNREKGNNSELSVESETSLVHEVRRIPPMNPSTYIPAYPRNINNYNNYTQSYPVNLPRVSRDKDHTGILLNTKNFEKLIVEKLQKENLDLPNPNEFLLMMNIGLDSYIKSVLEKLISIARIRNVNLNLYSKQSEKNPSYKIHTTNLDKSSNPNINEIVQSPYESFSIIFTKNMKIQMNLLEEYEELNLKKLRHDRATLLKKLEESSGNNNNNNNNNNYNNNNGKAHVPSTSVTNLNKPKQRVRKRDTMLKNVRNTLAKSQKREEMARQKKETQNTLDTFLDNKSKSIFPSNLSGQRLDSEMVSNIAESHNYESYTKMSEFSKSEMQGTIAVEGSSQDINLTIFKHSTPSQNVRLPPSTNVKRRITLKDLIQYLEGERRTPLQNLILHKAVVKLNQYSH
jgi:hypothetical protein